MLADSDITSVTLIIVGKMMAEGRLSSTNAKILLGHLWDEDTGGNHAAEKLGLLQISDRGSLEKIADQVISNNPGPVEQYKAGEQKVMGFLVGQVMKESKGQANPPLVNEILKKKLK